MRSYHRNTQKPFFQANKKDWYFISFNDIGFFCSWNDWIVYWKYS